MTKTDYTVVGFLSSSDVAISRIVAADNAGVAARQIMREYQSTDYKLMGVLKGQQMVLGTVDLLRLETPPVTYQEPTLLTVIGFDLYLDLAEEAPMADGLRAHSWEHAMLAAISMKSRSYQPVCVIEGHTSFVITLKDLVQDEAYADVV